MKKSLILTEKPSVGRDIARVLGCNGKNNGYFENGQYIVTWALGHLVTLASPEKYNKAFETWTMDALPMIPKPFKLEVINTTSKQYSIVKRLMDREDVKDIIIATDAGREGELVARWIIDYGKCKKPTRRLWISSVTDKAIKDGFANLKDGKNYDRLYQAAKARAEADWIVGLNGTRALTCKHNASLSMGRVQTPSVALIMEREVEIQKFVPQVYYEIQTDIKGFKCKYQDAKTGQVRILDKDKADLIFKNCRGKKGTVKRFESTEKKSYSTGFYDLTLLQQDANRLYNFSAKETLNIMQSLYEKHKVLTYPRTDSRYITKDIVATLSERVGTLRTGGFKDIAAKVLKSPITGNSSFVNDSKVGDHHAIIPTEQRVNANDFLPKEQKIYNLVVQKFLAALLPPHRYQEVSLEVDIEGNMFKGKGTKDIDLGWKEVYEGRLVSLSPLEGVSKEGFVTLKVSDKVDPQGLNVHMGKTGPPSYYTEGELLRDMEESGLGTVATRGDIIEKIVDNHYIDKQDKYLKMTKTGRQLLELVPHDIKSKELTAKWEKELEAIAKGQKSDKLFMDEMINFTQKIIREIKADQSVFKHENVSTESCPTCGKKLLVLESKNGKRLACPDRECGFKKNLSKTTNARCPECKKKLDLVGEDPNKTFVCSCGFKEKLEAFNKRHEQKANQMSKHEVEQFLQKSNKKEEAFNNPFADLLNKK